MTEVNTTTIADGSVKLAQVNTKYYLWSCRASAWMNYSGAYTNDRANARLVEYAEAVEICKVHRGMMGEFGMIPVAAEMLKEIKQ